MLLIPFLFACGSIPTTGPTPVSSLPDLAILSVHVSDVDENNNCLHGYVIMATIINRGDAPAYNVTLAEMATGVSTPVQVLGANEKFVVHFPVAAGGMYTVVADPDNSILESDETNNSLSYVAPTPTPSIPCAPTAAPIPPPSDLLPTPIPPPSDLSLNGLIFADLTANYLTRIVPGGFMPLAQGANAAFSPDGRFAVLESGGDLLLAEPMVNPDFNLTNTPETIDRFPHWWPSNSPKIVFTSIGVGEEKQRRTADAPNVPGYLTMMNTDGTGYTVLSEIPSYTMPALSPDGKTIAYDELGSPRLYEIGTGILTFDPVQFGYLESLDNVYSSPSFSADGSQLTWWVTQPHAAPFLPMARDFSLAIFDLVKMKSRTLHSYSSPCGTLGWLPNPVWSPSGQWIAFQTRDETTSNDLWIMHQGGGIGQRLGLATNPVWSPDSQRLAFVQKPQTSSNLPSMLSIADVPSWNIQQPSLPAGIIPLVWVTSIETGAIQPFPACDTPATWGIYGNPFVRTPFVTHPLQLQGE